MIRQYNNKLVVIESDGTTLNLADIYCNSDDTKPTENLANGSKLTEVDTGKTYLFDEVNEEWVEYSAGGGGGGSANVFAKLIYASDETTIKKLEGINKSTVAIDYYDFDTEEEKSVTRRYFIKLWESWIDVATSSSPTYLNDEDIETHYPEGTEINVVSITATTLDSIILEGITVDIDTGNVLTYNN